LSSLYKHLDIYSFFHGFNICAFCAIICGVAPNLAGLATAIGGKDAAQLPKGATYICRLRWLVGMIVAFLIYTVAGKMWPMEAMF
jgi:nucleobase:cation symporter-1, NCS1 family